MSKAIVVAAAVACAASAGFIVVHPTNEPPQCWEDEVRVVVYDDPYGELEGTVGCVPADDLPVEGFRPEPDTNPDSTVTEAELIEPLTIIDVILP